MSNRLQESLAERMQMIEEIRWNGKIGDKKLGFTLFNPTYEIFHLEIRCDCPFALPERG